MVSITEQPVKSKLTDEEKECLTLIGKAFSRTNDQDPVKAILDLFLDRNMENVEALTIVLKGFLGEAFSRA